MGGFAAERPPLILALDAFDGERKRMDITTGAAIFSLLDQSLGLMKKARDVMPDSKEKRDLTKKLAEVEAAYRVAEAKAAKELGYELCQCTWPPQIMTVAASGQPECPSCKRRVGGTALANGETALEPLDKEELAILILLSKSADSKTLEDISKSIRIPEQRINYWLTSLVDREMIRQTRVPMVGMMYGLEQKGRGLLIKQGHL